MPKKRNRDTTASQKAIQLFAKLIFSGRKLYLGDLADAFQCSKPTVARLITAIEASGTAQVECGKEGGRSWYQLRNLPGTPHIGLTEEEVEHLALCRDLMERLLPDSFAEMVGNSLDKVATLIPRKENRAELVERRAKRVAWGGVNNNMGQEYFECLRKAIATQTVCEVVYRDVEYRFPDREALPTQYIFVPVRITSENDVIHIEGWKIQSGHRPQVEYPLTFEVQRIVSCQNTGKTFPDCPPLPEHEGAFGLVGFEAFPAKITFSENYASYIRERIWSEKQEVVNLPDGGIELHFMAADEDQLIGWVLSFGADAELVEPQFLRETMFEEAQALCAMYMSNTTGQLE